MARRVLQWAHIDMTSLEHDVWVEKIAAALRGFREAAERNVAGPPTQPETKSVAPAAGLRRGLATGRVGGARSSHSWRAEWQ
jgi:hypothetical protein